MSKRLLFTVTSDMSLVLLGGFPEYMASQGWDVHVACSPGEKAAVFQQKGVTLHTVPMRRDPSPVKDFMGVIAWVRLLLRLKPDVISYGTPKAALLAAIASFITRIPRRIYHLRGLRLEGTVGFSQTVLTVLEKLTSALSHKVLAVSKSLKEEYIARKLAPESKMVVLGQGSSNGVNIQRFMHRPNAETKFKLLRELELQDNLTTIGFVGRLTKDKGLSELTEARDILISRGVPHQFLIVGGIDTNLDTSDPVLNERSSLTGYPLRITGFVDDTAPYYDLIDLLVLPTYREGFPNVILEAAASGKPSITTKATGAKDSVQDSVTGYLVPVGDSQLLASRIEEMVRNPTLRTTLGKNAFEYATNGFEQKNFWKLSNEFYEQQLLQLRSP